MKPIALLAFFFLLFASTTTAEFVLDSDGDPLLKGSDYYLSSPGIGGVVILSAAIRRGNTQDCSLTIIAALYKPALSTSTPYHIQYILTKFPANIEFAHLPPNTCTNSSEWLVIESRPLGQPAMVGDAKEFPESVVKGWFQIKRYHDSEYYKLVFNTGSQDKCGHFGVHNNNEKEYSRLVVTDKNTLVFKFLKVKESYVLEYQWRCEIIRRRKKTKPYLRASMIIV